MHGSVLALACHREHSPAEERAHQDDASEVDAQCPPGLCITTGAKPVNCRKRKNAQGQHVQPAPPLVTDALAQQGADADGNAEVQRDHTERHPYGAIMTGERNKYLVPPKVGEGIDPDGQDMHSEKDRAEQREGEQDVGGETACPRDVPGNGFPDGIHRIISFIRCLFHGSSVSQALSSCTSKPAMRCPRRKSAPNFEPRMNATLAATSACSQRSATTVTDQRSLCAGSPVRGSSRWCRSVCPCHQWRRAMPEVATAP